MGKRGMSPLQARKKRVEQGLSETKLQKLRVAKGLSQNDLAEKSRIPIRTIQKYEQQAVSIDRAKLDIICSLCLVLDCKIEDILENNRLIEKFKVTK